MAVNIAGTEKPDGFANPNTLANKTRKPAAWLSSLDTMRGMAALYVVCHHARTLLLISIQDSQSTPTSWVVKLEALLFGIFSFGHQAVILFFVLSGFCIHYRQAEKFTETNRGDAKFNIGRYIQRRFRRIMPPYYFALMLTGIFAVLTNWINPGFSHHMTDYSFANQLIVQHLSWQTLIGNIFFLQSLACPTFGNDTPLWSLAYEFYLYLLYPIFIFLQGRLTIRQSCGIVFLTSAIALGLQESHLQLHFFLFPVLSYWFCWILGAIVAEIYVGNLDAPRIFRYPSFAALFFIAWILLSRKVSTGIVDQFGALSCAIFLLWYLNSQRSGWRINFTQLRYLQPLGKFSYSLYLTHVPVLSFISSIWFISHTSFPHSPLLFLFGVSISILTGWISFQLVEKHLLS